MVYHFGILTSSIHMAWIQAIGGRLNSDYQYSATVVYNNFAWFLLTEEQRRLIEQTAQNILDVRSRYPQSTLANLYDELTMPKDLRDAYKKTTALLRPLTALKIFWTTSLKSSRN